MVEKNKQKKNDGGSPGGRPSPRAAAGRNRRRGSAGSASEDVVAVGWRRNKQKRTRLETSKCAARVGRKRRSREKKKEFKEKRNGEGEATTSQIITLADLAIKFFLQWYYLSQWRQPRYARPWRLVSWPSRWFDFDLIRNQFRSGIETMNRKEVKKKNRYFILKNDAASH